MRLYQQKADCQACHGWAGDGHKTDSQMPTGANLRETKLNRAGLITVIKCGRLNSQMPAFDKFAYSDGRCYGKKQADLKAYPTRMPDPPSTLQQREIDLIADFLLAKIVGKGPMDHDKCVEFWGSETDACKELKKKISHKKAQKAQKETIFEFLLCFLCLFVADLFSSVQRENKHITRVLQVIKFHRMQVPATGLHGEVLLGSDRVRDRRAFQRSAHVKAPQLLERLIVVSNDPAILQCREQHASGGVGRTRSNFDIGNSLRDDFMVDRIEGGHGTVIKVAVVVALLAILLVQTAIRRKEG